MKARKTSTQKAPGKSKKKIFFIGLGLLTAGVLSYFGVNYFKQRKKPTEDASMSPDASTPKPKAASKPAIKPKVKTTAVPTPKKKAATKKQQPTAKPDNTQTPPQQTPPQKPFLATVLALGIHTATIKRDFASVWEYLKGIKSVADYTAVNNVFKNYFTGGVRKTLVNGLLTTFTDEKQKQQLRKAFTAMGLKYNGSKWSLSGMPGQQLLITTQETRVWKNPKESVSVPVNMVLGKEIAKRGTFTMFETDHQHFLVESKTISYYKPN